MKEIQEKEVISKEVKSNTTSFKAVEGINTIKNLQDLKRVFIDRDFDFYIDLEDVFENVPFIEDYVYYYNYYNKDKEISFSPENCKFEIKTTQDLIKANAFRSPTLKFVKKIPLKNLCYRLDIGTFVQQWNEHYEKNVNESSKKIDFDKLLKDKVLLDTLELQLNIVNSNFISETNTNKIKVIEEKIDDLSKSRQDLKKSIKEREAQASIIRRKNLIDSLKSQINYDNIKY